MRKPCGKSTTAPGRSCRAGCTSRIATRGTLGSLASDAVLAVLLGKEPLTLRYAPTILLEAMFPEVIEDIAPALTSDLLATLRQDYRTMDIATLLRAARAVDIEDLRAACRQGQIVSAYLAMELIVLLVSALACGTAGEELDALFSGPDRALQLLASGMGVAMSRSLFSDPSRATLIGLELLVINGHEAKGARNGRSWPTATPFASTSTAPS